MVPRAAEVKILELARVFPAVALIGPRHFGKTTLALIIFPDKPYLLLEDSDIHSFAEEDPRSFLGQYSRTGAVIDEVQYVPSLFSYL